MLFAPSHFLGSLNRFLSWMGSRSDDGQGLDSVVPSESFSLNEMCETGG